MTLTVARHFLPPPSPLGRLAFDGARRGRVVRDDVLVNMRKKAPGTTNANHPPARALPSRRLTSEDLEACLEKRLADDPLADFQNMLRPFLPEGLDWDDSARRARRRDQEMVRLTLWAILDAYVHSHEDVEPRILRKWEQYHPWAERRCQGLS